MKKWDKISHQKSNKSDIDNRSADESHFELRGERDVICLRNPTEDKRAFRRRVKPSCCRRAPVGDVKLVCLALWWREREYLTLISIRFVAFSNQNFADYRP